MAKTFDGLTPAQNRVLEQIATMGPYRGHHPKVIAELERRGLIVGQDVEVGRDRYGPIVVREHQMPLAQHMRWCQWCAGDQRTEGGNSRAAALSRRASQRDAGGARPAGPTPLKAPAAATEGTNG